MANEKRLIDADKIYDAVERRYQVSSGIEHRCERDLLDLICAAETVDAVEVVQAKWILVDKEKGKGICSNCHRQDSIDPIATHCRFCGAKMDGDGNGNL